MPVPDGWELNAPPELNYTWQDLMQNIDGIRFFVINPDDITFDACWRLGADNVTVTYGSALTPASEPRAKPTLNAIRNRADNAAAITGAT